MKARKQKNKKTCLPAGRARKQESQKTRNSLPV